MPKGSPAPWFRECRKSWFVTIGGKQINLKTADRREANRRWHELAVQSEVAVPIGSRLGASGRWRGPVAPDVEAAQPGSVKNVHSPGYSVW
jgi:hypothetical protein